MGGKGLKRDYGRPCGHTDGTRSPAAPGGVAPAEGDLRGPTGATVPLSPRFFFGPWALKPLRYAASGALESPRGSAQAKQLSWRRETVSGICGSWD